MMQTKQYSRWPSVILGNLISLKSVFFQIEDTEAYKLVTAQWHAGGVVPRAHPTKLGRDIKTKRQQRLAPGDLLVAEIDAKEGGFGIVPQSLDGAIVSSPYFTYTLDT